MTFLRIREMKKTSTGAEALRTEKRGQVLRKTSTRLSKQIDGEDLVQFTKY